MPGKNIALFLLLAAPLAATPIGPGPPACISGTLATYAALGGTGCLLDTEVGVYDFSLTVISGAIAAGSINVTPTTGLYFGQLDFTSASFSVAAGSVLKFVITYNIDPHPILWEAEDFLDVSSPVAPGFAKVVTDVCIGANFTPLCGTFTNTINVLHNGAPVQLTDSTSYAPTNLLGVQNTFTLDGGPSLGGGSSNIDGLRNRLFETPEPATAGMALMALAGLGLLRKRR